MTFKCLLVYQDSVVWSSFLCLFYLPSHIFGVCFILLLFDSISKLHVWSLFYVSIV